MTTILEIMPSAGHRVTIDAIAIRVIFEFLPIPHHAAFASVLGHHTHSLDIVRVLGIHLPGCQKSVSVMMSVRGIEAAYTYGGSISRSIALAPEAWVSDWVNYIKPIQYYTIFWRLGYATSSQISREMEKRGAWGKFVRGKITTLARRQ